MTCDLMLSDEAAFEGGSFATLEPDGVLHTQPFASGDALVFVSHKYHCVQRVEAGAREVLVIELWRGPRRRCAHRCTTQRGECAFRPSRTVCSMVAVSCPSAAEAV